MRYIIITRIYVTGRDHSNASRASSAHAHAHANAHTALQATQRAMCTAMMAMTMMAAMGAATAAVQRDAASQRIIRRLYGTDHCAAAHDVRQLIGLDIKVLRLSQRPERQKERVKQKQNRSVSVEHIESPKELCMIYNICGHENKAKLIVIQLPKLSCPQDISRETLETIV